MCSGLTAKQQVIPWLVPAGATTPEAASGASRSSFSASNGKTTGTYLQQEFSLHNALLITGGVRRDRLSTFGSNFDTVLYPSVDVSWLLSEHGVFSQHSWLNTLQLQSAYGTSGQAPNTANGVNALTIWPIADVPDHKTEHSAEWESGADIRMFGGASNVALSYYRTKTTNVLVRIFVVVLPNPVVTTYRSDGAEVHNTGVELSLFQHLVSKPQFSTSIMLTANANKNRLISLPVDVPPIFAGNRTTQKNAPGYPLYGFWGRTYTFADANNDGIITGSEMTFSDTAQFIGSSFPTRTLAVSPAVDFFNHKLRVYAQLDSKWGFKKFNNTLRHQCQSALSCRARNDRSASLADQAAAVAITQGALTGMIEDGAFTRLREASVLYELPTRWASAIRASSWDIVLTGRNLGVATNYSGIDPEASVSTTDARQDEYFSTPMARYYTLPLNVRF
ncbi:MAG: TonB-dependent receptor [Gemmatimonadaceae bacterium]